MADYCTELFKWLNTLIRFVPHHALNYSNFLIVICTKLMMSMVLGTLENSYSALTVTSFFQNIVLDIFKLSLNFICLVRSSFQLIKKQYYSKVLNGKIAKIIYIGEDIMFPYSCKK